MINPELFSFHNFLPVCLLVIFSCLIIYGIVAVVSKLIKTFLIIVIFLIAAIMLIYGGIMYAEGKVKQAQARIEGKSATGEWQPIFLWSNDPFDEHCLWAVVPKS